MLLDEVLANRELVRDLARLERPQPQAGDKCVVEVWGAYATDGFVRGYVVGDGGTNTLGLPMTLVSRGMTLSVDEGHYQTEAVPTPDVCPYLAPSLMALAEKYGFPKSSIITHIPLACAFLRVKRLPYTKTMLRRAATRGER